MMLILATGIGLALLIQSAFKAQNQKTVFGSLLTADF